MEYEVQMRERWLTIVLLDLIGSTAFVQKYGAQRAATHFQFHDRLARSLLYKYEGREIDRSDGFLCSFDRPIDAVNFALIYQKTIPLKQESDVVLEFIGVPSLKYSRMTCSSPQMQKG